MRKLLLAARFSIVWFMTENSSQDCAQLADERLWRTPAGVTRHYRQGRFGQLHYRLAMPQAISAGQKIKKPALLCLHPTSNSSRIYNQLLAQLGCDRIVIAIDTPGFGLSDPLPFQPSIADYSAYIAELIAELAKELDFQQLDLLGYHAGSKIAVTLARQQPNLVRRLALISTPIYTKEELAEQQKLLDTPLTNPWPTDGTPLKNAWQTIWSSRDELADVWFVQREVAEGLNNLEHTHAASLAELDVQFDEQLPLIEHPLLVICPGDDLWSATLKAKPFIRNGKFIERQSWSNGFLDLRTNECAELLRDFFDGSAADRGRDTQLLIAPTYEAAITSKPLIQRGFHDGPYGALHYRLANPPTASNLQQPRRPIVLLHMSPNSSRVFDALVISLSATRTVLALDTPGFGESEPPMQPIGIEQFAATTLYLIQALDFDEVDVLGYHTGSMTAIELALIAPDRIKHVVQISSPIYTPEEQLAASQKYRAKELQNDGSHLVAAWQNLQKFYNPDIPRALLGRNFTASLKGGPMSHWGHQAAFIYPLAAKLPLVEQPVLVINPEDDLVDKTRRAPQLLQQGRLHELPGRSHGFMDQITDEFTLLLAEFLDKS